MINLHRKKADWSDGVYVRIVGSLRSFNNKRNIVAFRIQPLTDFNELTYHFLEVIYVHLFNTKGGQVAQGGFANNTANVYANPYHHQQIPHPQPSDQIHKAILDVIYNSQATGGTSIEYICTQLNRSEKDIRSAIDFF